MLVNSGGIATQPRAPGHDRPFTASAGAVRRGMAVCVPPRGHRVLTYPRPPRPGRRVSTVCVPPIWHRVRSDPAPPCVRRGLAVRVPPRGHRVLTYPRPLRPGRRVSIVCVPWRLPPWPCRPASAGRARRACPTPLPIPASQTYSSAHQDTAHTRTVYHLTTWSAQSRESRNPPLSTWWRGAGGEDCNLFPPSGGRPLLSNQVHPAIQVPPHPRPCSTAAGGFPLHHPSRAPPASCPAFPRERASTPSPNVGEGAG